MRALADALGQSQTLPYKRFIISISFDPDTRRSAWTDPYSRLQRSLRRKFGVSSGHFRANGLWIDGVGSPDSGELRDAKFNFHPDAKRWAWQGWSDRFANPCLSNAGFLSAHKSCALRYSFNKISISRSVALAPIRTSVALSLTPNDSIY